jgi:hypothetical protein
MKIERLKYPLPSPFSFSLKLAQSYPSFILVTETEPKKLYNIHIPLLFNTLSSLQTQSELTIPLATAGNAQLPQPRRELGRHAYKRNNKSCIRAPKRFQS